METLIQQAVQLYENASAALERGDFTCSDALHLECIALFQQADGPLSLNAASVYTALADLRQQVGDLDGALHAASQADSILAAIGEDSPGDDPITASASRPGRRSAPSTASAPNIPRLKPGCSAPSTWRSAILAKTASLPADARNELGMLYKYTAEFDKAEALYRAALAHLLDRFGEQHSSVAALYHNLGGLEHARQRFTEGEPYARKAWEINRHVLGEEHPTTLADAAAYAGLLDGLERYTESEPIYRRVLAGFTALYGEEHYEIAVNLNNLANVRNACGDPQEAEALFLRAIAIKEKILGPDHPDTALSLNNLGVILREQGRTGEARRLFRRALRIFRHRLGDEHPKTQMARG